jgi:hypothetical protein
MVYTVKKTVIKEMEPEEDRAILKVEEATPPPSQTPPPPHLLCPWKQSNRELGIVRPKIQETSGPRQSPAGTHVWSYFHSVESFRKNA